MRKCRLTQSAVFERYGAVSDIEKRHALIDVAQDHFLAAAHEQGVFGQLGTRFVGGTALRKHRFGAEWRISHDIDFGVPTKAERAEVLDRLDGSAHGPFRFRILYGKPLAVGVESRLTDEDSVFRLDVSSDDRREYGRITPPAERGLLPMPAGDLYGWDASEMSIPTLTVEENLAEKLCRQHRKPVARDVHDIAAMSDVLTGKAPLIAKLAARTVWERNKAGFVTQNARSGELVAPGNYRQMSHKALADLLRAGHNADHRVEFIPTISADDLLERYRGWYNAVNRALRPFHEAVLADERLTVLSFVPQKKMLCDVPSPLEGVTEADQRAMIAEIESEIRQAVHDGELDGLPAGTVPDGGHVGAAAPVGGQGRRAGGLSPHHVSSTAML